MKDPALLTIGRFYEHGSLVLWDGEKEVAAVFGSPTEQRRRAAELITGANLLRLLRASRVNATITKGAVKCQTSQS